MIDERSRIAPADEAAGTRCPGCGEAVEAARCGACGAVRAAGGYRVDKVLARTPHSRVYLARDDSGRKVALKELVFALVPDAARLEAFDREAELLRQLDHPAVPRFFGSFREGEGVHLRLYLAQEFVEGRSVLEWIGERRAGEEDARRLAREVLQVLAYLHGLSPRVLHRDLKPANLLRRPDGSIAVVDFGAARDLEGGVTHGATLVGTFGYMPPEQLGGTVDQTCDLYALGATLVHLLARRPPWELLVPGTTELDWRRAVNVSPSMHDFLQRLVAPRREDRFQTAQEALRALDAPAQTVQPPAPAPTRRLPLLVGGASLVVALAVALVAVSWETAPPQPVVPTTTTVTVPPQPPVALPQPPPPVRTPPPAAQTRRRDEAEPVVLERVAGPREKVFVLTRSFALAGEAEVQTPRTGCEKPSRLVVRSAKVEVEGERASLAVDAVFEAGSGDACLRSQLTAVDPKDGGALGTVALRSSEGSMEAVPARFRLSPTQRSVRLVVGSPRDPDGTVEVDLVGRTLR